MTVQFVDQGFGMVPTFDIMVDYDDVIMPWAETVHDKCEEIGLHDGSEKWASWHMWENYPGPDGRGCDKDLWLHAVSLAVEDGLYTATDPYPNAVIAMNSLIWMGHRVHIVTARGFMADGERIRRWTHEHIRRYGIGHTTLTFNKDKVAAQRDLGVEFDYAIDDGIHNFDALHEAGVPTWLHTQPHNVDHPAELRVNSLWEFAQMVHRHQSQAAVIA